MSLCTADPKSGEAHVRPVMDASCASIAFLLFFMIERLHSVFPRVWAPHCQLLMWRSLLSVARVRNGRVSAADGLVVVFCDVDLVFVADVAIAASVDIDCNVVGGAVADAIGMTTGLRGERDRLLGGVGSIEAIVIFMLVFPAGVFGRVKCSGIVDTMLGKRRRIDGRENIVCGAWWTNDGVKQAFNETSLRWVRDRVR
jgi:hypothetical protein